MGAPQWIFLIMVLLDAFGFLNRHIKNDEFTAHIIIMAFFVRYGCLVAVLNWGGWYG